MRRAAMTSVVVVAMLAPLTALFTSGNACAGVRSMTWNDTCLAACGSTPRLYTLCQDTLRHEAAADRAKEVTVYALTASRRVARAYDGTVDQAERLILNGSLAGGDERGSYLHCIASYGTARAEMVGVDADVADCQFARTRERYLAAVAAVESCGDGLKAGTPLAPRNAADRDLTVVAYDLGALLFGKS